MFKDQITGKFSEKGEKCHRLTVAKRSKDYYGYRLDEEQDDYLWQKIGSGEEPRLEVNTTEDGIKVWESWSPEQKQSFVQSLEKASSVKVDTKRRMAR